MAFKSISGSAIKRIAPKLEQAGIYSAGQGETSLKGGLESEFTFYNVAAGILEAWLFCSRSAGITSSVVVSRSQGGLISDNMRATQFDKMLDPMQFGSNWFDVCSQGGKYCVVENTSGSGLFVNGDFAHFTGSASIDAKEVFNNFQDVMTNQISLNITEGMTSHLQYASAMAYLSGSVTSSINDIRALYGKPAL